MRKGLLLTFVVVGVGGIVAGSCDKNFCEDYPNSEFCPDSSRTPSPSDSSYVGGVSCPDTGSAGYFPLVVGSSWSYQVFEGTSLDSTSDSVLNPTGNVWDETVSMINDSTWVTSYSGGPYDGAEDTAFVFLRGDTLYMRVVKTTSIGGGTPITVVAESPFAWYPLREGDSISTDWDTLPPADYIGGDGGTPDTIEYRITAIVRDTTTYTVGTQDFCAQKVQYRTTLHVLNMGLWINLNSYFWWTPYVGVVKRIERNLRDTSGTKWLQKDLRSFSVP